MSFKRKFKRNNFSANHLPCERKCGVCHGKMQLKQVGEEFMYICGCGRVKKEKTAICCEIYCNCCKKRNSSLEKVVTRNKKSLVKVEEMKKWKK